MSSKYQPLTLALTAAAERGQRVVELGFEEIADLVGGLPSSARLRQWWANTDHPQARAWLAAGYGVQQVYLDRRRVRFGGLAAPLVRGVRDAASLAPASATAARTGSLVDVQVRLQWVDAGPVVLDGAGKLAFPRQAASQGLYMLSFAGPGARVYIGESENLHRRLSGNYRNPGPSQRTSARINALLREHLLVGGTVLLAVATSATVVIDGHERPLDLSNKTSRLLVENAALVHARATGDAQIVNLG